MDKINRLLSEMTIKEKLAQITQIMVECLFGGEGNLMGITYGFDIPDELKQNIGSVLGLSGAEKHHEVQRDFLSANKHKIPLLFMADVIHGYKTIFPSPLAMACSFDPEAIMYSAEISAKEAAAAGVHVTFSPMCDLSRDSRWGRVVEGTGEDPLLNSLYAAAFVRGYQGDDVKSKERIAACAKHFAGYGAAESGRDYNTTEIGEYTFKEFYLPAYKAAVDAGCKMIMTAFNALNSIPCTGNPELMRKLLREQWGFKGTVISDCTAIYELIPHGYCEDAGSAAKRALEAGVDIEMVSTAYYETVEELIRESRLYESLLDEAVKRVLELKEDLGLFDDPYSKGSAEMEKALLLCNEHRQAARTIAQKSMVLLENDGILPIAPENGIAALIGPYAESNMLLDVWKCVGEEKDCITVAQGLKGRIEYRISAGCDIEGGTDVQMNEAVKTAESCDYIILAVGEHPEMSAEAGSRAYLTLPDKQMELLNRLHKTGKKIITVIFAGRPLELKEIKEKSAAVLYAWFPGTEGGAAIADLLTGAVEPTGRLPVSFPYTVGQLPLYYNAYPTGRPDYDGEQRFASRFLDAPSKALYPFGYGLGFGCFEYGKVRLNTHSMTKNDDITASVSVKNIGKLRGTETVQLYIRDMAGSVVRPVKELKGFKKITLNPNEESEVSFKITEEMLRFHSPGGYMSESGKFTVFIGGNSAVQNNACFTLSLINKTAEVTNACD